MALYLISVTILGFFLIWLIIYIVVNILYPPSPQLRNKRITLLIGHPDDEAMFFGPSILALTSPAYQNNFKILCLSTGNAIGEGPIRIGELLDSARRLGIASASDVDIVEDPRFQDGPGTDWKKEDIADLLFAKFNLSHTESDTVEKGFTKSSDEHVAQHAQNGKATVPTLRHPQDSNSPASDLDRKQHAEEILLPEVIVTFDPHGISLHPNHCACYTGATHFLHRLANAHNPTTPTLYTLTTIPTWRKYLHIFDTPLSIFFNRPSSSPSPSIPPRTTPVPSPETIIILSHPSSYLRAAGAMVFAHKTQMLWFRWAWILLGRYMLVNCLRREDLDLALDLDLDRDRGQGLGTTSGDQGERKKEL